MFTITGVRPFGLFDTIIIFEAETEDGIPVLIAADHRPARDIRAALAAGDQPQVNPPDYMVLPLVLR